jgi:hypothetical protein
MSQSNECAENFDPLKLVREGTCQEERFPVALDADYIKIDEKTTAHLMVFAQAFTVFLNYFNSESRVEGNWQPFFNSDVSILLAIAATGDVDFYRSRTKEYLEFLRDRKNRESKDDLRDNLEALFSCCASLAIQLNRLEQILPGEIAFKQKLQIMAKNRLGPALERLISYFKGNTLCMPEAKRPLNPPAKERAAFYISNGMKLPLKILGADAVKFSSLETANLGRVWGKDNPDWAEYYGSIPKDNSVYKGNGTSIFARVNHIATHYHFTSALDQFLKEYAYVRKEARHALEESINNWNKHEPHYALFLTFLRLLENARVETNTLTQRHLDFYYKEILQLKEKDPLPTKAHLLAELAKQVKNHELKKGTLFKAGKDDQGKNLFFAAGYDFVANRAQVAHLKTLYRHDTEEVQSQPNGMPEGRVFASPVANSDDGLGAKLTSADLSWAPFFNKSYKNGDLDSINMPPAEIGFAIFSHHLLISGGARTITLGFKIESDTSLLKDDYGEEIECFLSCEKEWYKADVQSFDLATKSGNPDEHWLTLTIQLTGSVPPIVPWAVKVHGHSFATELPVLLIKLKQQNGVPYIYNDLQDLIISKVDLTIHVTDLKTILLSNDFGPIDPSKPFQPWGANPVANGSLVIGSKEVFQKHLTQLSVSVDWHTAPVHFANSSIQIQKEYLQNGKWVPNSTQTLATVDAGYDFLVSVTSTDDIFSVDEPDFSSQEAYSSSSRYGYLRLRLESDFGRVNYEDELNAYIKKVVDGTLAASDTQPLPPVGPFAGEIRLNYTSQQSSDLLNPDLTNYEDRKLYFYHLAPFGHAEQHGRLKNISENNTPVPDKSIYLLPQMKHLNRLDRKLASDHPVYHEAEFYIGIKELAPPQNLSLLFQMADGTADPQSNKPDPHIHWSYLRGNEWLPFNYGSVQDTTNGLLQSGIITFVIPRDASSDNTLLQKGIHWIRGAVEKESDAVCRLLQVYAQAIEVSFEAHENDPRFGAKVLPPGTINKLDVPHSGIKKVSQPFESFGGRVKESTKEFQTRISERLRHKDRAMALWDYERLVLEAFPEIYKAKCLNHTQYEQKSDGTGFVYREMAPGHVTVVTIPNQQHHNLRDPLRPFTSLGLLEKIADFLSNRISCFITLHVKNPVFEDVKITCRVRFMEGVDETFHLDILKKEITRFLSPWAFSSEDYPAFGGRFQKSAIINFIEELSYIDYISDLKLEHTWQNSDGSDTTEEKNRIEGSRAISILVSAREHDITPIKESDTVVQGEACRC